jgi:hypothetical protein
MRPKKARERRTVPELEDVIWYAATMLTDNGRLQRETFCVLGLDLLRDFLSEQQRLPFPPGLYAIGCWRPKLRHSLPDWGTLEIRGIDRWIFRSRDGQAVWAAGRRGLPICLRGGD